MTDTQRLALLASHGRLLIHQSSGSWHLCLRGLDLPVVGGTLEEAIDRAIVLLDLAGRNLEETPA